MPRAKISAVLITRNEERNIRRCLESLRWVDEIVVVDGHSTDTTAAIAKEYGARVISHAFEGDFGMERNIGSENATGDWILALDADEEIPVAARRKIEEILESDPAHSAFNVPRLQYFLGKPLMHGGRYHSIVNFYKRGKAHFDGKVHHLVHVDGTVGQFEEPFHHYPFHSISEFIQKHDRYTRFEALEMYEKWKDGKVDEVKRNLTVKPFKLFFKTYVKKRGYKDGIIGLVFCMLFAWSYFVRWAKYWEICQEKKAEGS
jgi:glycosyltransferase involved in cell wall biosynthesis